MLSNSNNKGKIDDFFSVPPEPVVTPDSTAAEDVVIYDECGDTLWDRVLLQEDKAGNTEQNKTSEPG